MVTAGAWALASGLVVAPELNARVLPVLERRFWQGEGKTDAHNVAKANCAGGPYVILGEEQGNDLFDGAIATVRKMQALVVKKLAAIHPKIDLSAVDLPLDHFYFCDLPMNVYGLRTVTAGETFVGMEIELFNGRFEKVLAHELFHTPQREDDMAIDWRVESSVYDLAEIEFPSRQMGTNVALEWFRLMQKLAKSAGYDKNVMLQQVYVPDEVVEYDEEFLRAIFEKCEAPIEDIEFMIGNLSRSSNQHEVALATLELMKNTKAKAVWMELLGIDEEFLAKLEKASKGQAFAARLEAGERARFAFMAKKAARAIGVFGLALLSFLSLKRKKRNKT